MSGATVTKLPVAGQGAMTDAERAEFEAWRGEREAFTAWQAEQQRKPKLYQDMTEKEAKEFCRQNKVRYTPPRGSFR